MVSQREGRVEHHLPTVVIVGAGFGGLRVARGLRGAPLNVLILDRHNYHLFVPLLYQVATAGLEPEEIAQPIRRILRGAANVRFQLAEVSRVDLEHRVLGTELGDAGPTVSRMKRERNPGVRCSDFVRQDPQ
ncbi:MAG: FAD-dependent oxidoreductase [Chloroflexi bacterium]|nr:FAD-dependent oxidoreductase [Chloroflexota bacterium]